MNGNIDLNLTKAKQSSLQTEPNDSETDDTNLIDSENDLTPEGRTVLIAKGAAMNPPPPKSPVMNPPPNKDNISAEPEVNTIV
jgi:hypothetical protein